MDERRNNKVVSCLFLLGCYYCYLYAFAPDVSALETRGFVAAVVDLVRFPMEGTQRSAGHITMALEACDSWQNILEEEGRKG
jgi:hypothetical protein